MKSVNAIKNFESRQTRQIAGTLIDRPTSRFNWRIIVFPLFLYDVIRYRRRLQVHRKNLFFTKKFALQAAAHVHQGKERAWEIRQIEIKTGEVLDKEKKGFYTDKIRNRQLREFEF
ncbi:MAG: NF038143 family protein, partial [Deltaproteobacteria bacterium]|nr:NF038143 family protein [Deltaproteobacteria bacterium]